MRALVLTAIVLAACSFRAANDPDPDSDPDAATPTDSPPAEPLVHFTSVEANVTELRPGRYGIEVSVVLRNDLEVDIEDVEVTLTFSDGTSDRAGDFRWRDADRREGLTQPAPTGGAAGTDATYRFVVDALPWAAPPGPILINGSATFTSGGASRSATPLDPPLMLPFAAMNAPIVVNTAVDQDNGNDEICLREALKLADSASGPDRIVFDPVQFPPGNPTVALISRGIGALPTVDEDLVIDGHGAGVVLAVDASWESSETYGLRLSSNTLVIHDLEFRNMGHQHRNEGNLDPPNSNCGPSDAQLEGGAIRVDNGTLVLDGNRFADPDVGERNCRAASIRIHGGTGHRILGNTWTEQSMDALYIEAAVVEITGNDMDARSSLTKVDECIYIASQGGSDLWITGNLCVDQEYSAVFAGGNDGGAMYVVNNTFVRNGREALSAVRRSGSRAIQFRNNVYLANNPAALEIDAGGAGFDLGYEVVSASPLCNAACTSAMIDTATMLMLGDVMVTDPGGSTRAAFTPIAGSPLVDSGIDWLDRNGSAPRRFTGAGPERGAVELP